MRFEIDLKRHNRSIFSLPEYIQKAIANLQQIVTLSSTLDDNEEKNIIIDMAIKSDYMISSQINNYFKNLESEKNVILQKEIIYLK